jgi:hypothetical protein
MTPLVPAASDRKPPPSQAGLVDVVFSSPTGVSDAHGGGLYDAQLLKPSCLGAWDIACPLRNRRGSETHSRFRQNQNEEDSTRLRIGQLHQATAIVDHEVQVSEQRITDYATDRGTVVRTDAASIDGGVVKR